MSSYLNLEGLSTYDTNIKNYIDKNKTNIIEFSLRIDDEGNLVCDYPEGTETPDLTINDEGFLVYTF